METQNKQEPNSPEILLREPHPGMLAGNLGEPILLPELRVDGFSASAARSGEKVTIISRAALTSDDPAFHTLAENLCGVIQHQLNLIGKGTQLKNAEYVLVVIRPDYSAELWVDTAAITLNIVAKRGLGAGHVVFENDIADIVGMRFPLVEIGSKDKVICLFRVDWRFALFFDFNPDGALSIESMTRDLGTLRRNLKYRHLYDVVSDHVVFGRLVDAGWFPFAEIIGEEFKELASCAKADFPMDDAEAKLVAAFDGARLERLLQRWLKKPHFASKEPILRSAIRSYLADEPIAVIKTISTEIQGVLNAAYRAVNGTGTRHTDKLLDFATSSAKGKFGAGNTLLMTDAFAEYLSKNTFSSFDPSGDEGNAGSRHAVSHGGAKPDTYTRARSLQALLTLDQFAFYT